MGYYNFVVVLLLVLLLVPHSDGWGICDMCDCFNSVINCRDRNISEFQHAESLPEFFVTFDLSDNQISVLGPGSFKDVPHSLENIDASGNRFEVIQHDTFSEFYDLRSINLSNNLIELIQENAFENHTTLEELILSFNQIEVILPKTFNSLPDLRVLDLSFNKMTTLGQFTLRNLSKLKTLNLSFLQLQMLQPSSFDWNLTIENLDISHNYLTSVPTTSLWYLRRSLAHLEFSGNLIQVIKEAAFMELSNLKTLKMEQYLHLKSVQDYAFKDLKNLETVVFRYWPKIINIESKAFHLSYANTNISVMKCPIRDFTLEFSSIYTMSEELLNWDNVRYLSMRNNRWFCDCRILWMKGTNIAELTGKTMFCYGPPNNENRKLFSVPDKDFTCNVLIHNKSSLGFVILILGVGITISFATVAVLIYRHNGWLCRRPEMNYSRVGSRTSTITIYDRTDDIELDNSTTKSQISVIEAT